MFFRIPVTTRKLYSLPEQSLMDEAQLAEAMVELADELETCNATDLSKLTAARLYIASSSIITQLELMGHTRETVNNTMTLVNDLLTSIDSRSK